MARSARQSKILEIISTKEIETQDELARELRNANFEILSSSGKYKYCFVGSDEQVISNKYISIFKESVISVKVAMNLVVVKTMKGLGSAIASFVDKLNINELLGAVNGDDTVMLIFPSTTVASQAVVTLNEMIG